MALHWELSCTPRTFCFRILEVIQTNHERITEGMSAMPTFLILALLVYGVFQLAKYLMSSTVGDAKSHIVGNWYSDSHNKDANCDLITFTKCISAFVFALLLYTVFYA